VKRKPSAILALRFLQLSLTTVESLLIPEFSLTLFSCILILLCGRRRARLMSHCVSVRSYYLTIEWNLRSPGLTRGTATSWKLNGVSLTVRESCNQDILSLILVT